MQRKEVESLRELYVSLAVTRAIEEVDELFTRTEAELEADYRRETELRAEALVHYRRERELLASEEEFEFIWRSIKDDLLREIRALEAMLG